MADIETTDEPLPSGTKVNSSFGAMLAVQGHAYGKGGKAKVRETKERRAQRTPKEIARSARAKTTIVKMRAEAELKAALEAAAAADGVTVSDLLREGAMHVIAARQLKRSRRDA